MNVRYSVAVLILLLAGCSASHTAHPAGILPEALSSALLPHSGGAGLLGTPQLPGSWTTKASMPTARYDLAVGVDNGVLYAVGGIGAGLLDTLEAYDPMANSWTAKASMPTPRGGIGVGVIRG